MAEQYMIIGGRHVAAGDTFEVFNPATGKLVGLAANATLSDLDEAVAAAEVAFRVWSRLPDAERKAACQALSAQLEKHAETLAHIITLEQGKPLNGLGSRFEVSGARAWADYTSNLDLPVQILQNDNSGRVELHRKPVGVVGSITPWNWPVIIAIWHIVPALRAGNTVVIKPSPYTPLATLMAVEAMNEVLPPGVLNIVTSDDKTHNIGAAMAAHPGIRKIVFTGSGSTGEKVMSAAGKTLKRLTLELGGNDAGIILPDCDPKTIVEDLFWGAFINNGQTCAAMKRLYVHDSIHDGVCDALVDFARNIKVGNGLEDDVGLGPISNKMQFEKVSRLVADAKQSGNVLTGGEAGEGLFFPITLVRDLPADASLIREEQFGPALPIIRYHDLEEAIAAANDSENGLGGSVWSRDIGKAKDIGKRLECGSVWINKHGAIQPNIPFGGVKKSGMSVEFGQEGLHENTDIQVIFG